MLRVGDTVRTTQYYNSKIDQPFSGVITGFESNDNISFHARVMNQAGGIKYIRIYYLEPMCKSEYDLCKFKIGDYVKTTSLFKSFADTSFQGIVTDIMSDNVIVETKCGTKCISSHWLEFDECTKLMDPQYMSDETKYLKTGVWSKKDICGEDKKILDLVEENKRLMNDLRIEQRYTNSIKGESREYLKLYKTLLMDTVKLEIKFSEFKHNTIVFGTIITIMILSLYFKNII